MRVLLLCMVLLGVFGVSGQQILTGTSFRITSGSAGVGYNFTANGVQYVNPTISVTAGTNLTISLEYAPFHPFGLSTTAATANFDQNQAFFPDTLNKNGFITVSAGCTNPFAAKNITVWMPANETASPCVLNVQIPSFAAGTTLYYRCAQHPLMVGSISVAAAPTTPAGPITGATLTGTSFRITAGSADKGYIFTDAGKQYLNPTLSVNPGTSVTFSLEYTGPHPFGFSPKADGNVALTQDFFPDSLNKLTTTNATSNCAPVPDTTVTVLLPNTNANGTITPCQLTIPVTANNAGATLYYRCAYHNVMVGTINVGGTAPTPAPKNTASTGAGAGLALFVALVAAFMA